MKCILIIILLILSLNLFSSDFNSCSNDFNCLNEIFKDTKAKKLDRIFAGGYLLTTLCKKKNLRVCTYDYASESINLIGVDPEFQKYIYDLKYYEAVSLYQKGVIHKNFDEIAKSIKILKNIVDNIDKLYIIFPYAVYLQIWKGQKEFGYIEESLIALDVAYKIAPDENLKKRLGQILFTNQKDFADKLSKNGACKKIEKCNKQLCLQAEKIYLKLKIFHNYKISENTYNNLYKKLIEEGIKNINFCQKGQYY